MPKAAFQQSDPGGASRWLVGRELVRTVVARQAADVLPALEAVQQAVQEGLHAVGFLAYEAAAGLDDAFDVHPNCPLPLVWFGLFRGVDEREEPAAATGELFEVGPWRPSVSREEYEQAIARVKRYIAAGDTYQVNYTFRLRASFKGEPWPFFCGLWRAQRTRHCAYIDTGDHVVCSASPELFFSLADGEIVSRPMKGTMPRGLDLRDDLCIRAALAASAKDRAENAMIVDMMRNVIGRVADAASVRVRDLFKIERYPPLFQMT
jgi:para-aminobenzoate synthetase / 4-amino-4-deoxychorismate lyase